MVDIEEFMAGMQALMGGESADPEQMAEMRQVFAYAMEQARQIDQEPGATDGLWNIIPNRFAVVKNDFPRTFNNRFALDYGAYRYQNLISVFVALDSCFFSGHS